MSQVLRVLSTCACRQRLPQRRQHQQRKRQPALRQAPAAAPPPATPAAAATTTTPAGRRQVRQQPQPRRQRGVGRWPRGGGGDAADAPGRAPLQHPDPSRLRRAGQERPPRVGAAGQERGFFAARRGRSRRRRGSAAAAEWIRLQGIKKGLSVLEILFNRCLFLASQFDSLEPIAESDYRYEVLLSDKGRDGKYRTIFTGESVECRLTDLRPHTEYHIRIHALYGVHRGERKRGWVRFLVWFNVFPNWLYGGLRERSANS